MGHCRYFRNVLRNSLFLSHMILTIFSKTQRLPLPPFYNSTDGSHPSIDQQHAQRSIQQEVYEVSRRDKCECSVNLQLELEDGELCGVKYQMNSQRAGIFLCEVRQVDISEMNKQHPNGLFRGVQEPAERQGKLFIPLKPVREILF